MRARAVWLRLLGPHPPDCSPPDRPACQPRLRPALLNQTSAHRCFARVCMGRPRPPPTRPEAGAQVYNVTLGGLAYTDEIFNVSIWFGNGQTRRLGWFPYSLYSFASDRLPTPRGGLLPPTNGANFTLATGWIGRCAAASIPRPCSASRRTGSGAWGGCPTLRVDVRGCLYCKCANTRIFFFFIAEPVRRAYVRYRVGFACQVSAAGAHGACAADVQLAGYCALRCCGSCVWPFDCEA